jgi:hypothetical protein
VASERDARKARMRAATARRTPEDAPAAGRTAIRSKPVRITVDLSPEDYRRLTAWTTSTAAALDVPRVTSADAVRAMIRATADDPMISDVVTFILRNRQEEQ